MTDPAIAERLLAIGDDFDQQAEAALDTGPDGLALPEARRQIASGRT